MTDRRTFVQQHSLNQVQNAIDQAVYGDDNKRIMVNLFIRNSTYEAEADNEHISVRGLHKRVKKIYPAFENYLNKLN